MKMLPISNTFYQPFTKYESEKMQLEHILQEYHRKNPNLRLSTPQHYRADDPLFHYMTHRFPTFQGFSHKQLEESTTIMDGMDIAIFRHIRYLPALLHTHEFFEMVYIIDGKCMNHIGNRKFFMQPGDVCIIAPGTEHSIAAFDDDCIILNFLIRTSTFDSTFMNIFSDMEIISDFFMKTLYGNYNDFYLLFHTGNDKEMLETIYQLLCEYHEFRRHKQKFTNLHIAMLFLLLIRNHEQDVFISNPRNTKSEGNFIYILHYLQANYLTLTLGELSSFFSYSERQMSRILHDYTGMSFSENIQKLRMEHAARLLRSTPLPISEVAVESGYTNTTHFRQIFKKCYGVGPSEFRNSNK